MTIPIPTLLRLIPWIAASIAPALAAPQGARCVQFRAVLATYKAEFAESPVIQGMRWIAPAGTAGYETLVEAFAFSRSIHWTYRVPERERAKWVQIAEQRLEDLESPVPATATGFFRMTDRRRRAAEILRSRLHAVQSSVPQDGAAMVYLNEKEWRIFAALLSAMLVLDDVRVAGLGSMVANRFSVFDSASMPGSVESLVRNPRNPEPGLFPFFGDARVAPEFRGLVRQFGIEMVPLGGLVEGRSGLASILETVDRALVRDPQESAQRLAALEYIVRRIAELPEIHRRVVFQYLMWIVDEPGMPADARMDPRQWLLFAGRDTDARRQSWERLLDEMPYLEVDNALRFFLAHREHARAGSGIQELLDLLNQIVLVRASPGARF